MLAPYSGLWSSASGARVAPGQIIELVLEGDELIEEALPVRRTRSLPAAPSRPTVRTVRGVGSRESTRPAWGRCWHVVCAPQKREEGKVDICIFHPVKRTREVKNWIPASRSPVARLIGDVSLLFCTPALLFSPLRAQPNWRPHSGPSRCQPSRAERWSKGKPSPGPDPGGRSEAKSKSRQKSKSGPGSRGLRGMFEPGDGCCERRWQRKQAH